MQVPATIDATGRTDVTKSLQTFVSKVPSGGVVRFRPGGRYRLDGTLVVSRRRQFTFDGAGALIFATTRGDQNRSQFRVRGGSNITFRNIKIQGASANAGTGDNAYIPKLAKQMGIRFEGVDGAEVDHVTISNVFGDFVYVGLDSKEVPSRNVWIHDSSFRSNGRQGVAITSATGVIIERNVFFNTRRSTIDLEPTGHRWKVDHVFILNNVVGKGRLLFVASGGQGPVSNVVVSGNRLTGHVLSIDVKQSGKQRRSNWVVVDNISNVKVDNNRVMRFMAVDGLLLRGNRETITGKDPAVLLSDVCGAVVGRNDFGTGQVQRQGKACAARLVIPQPPAIPGRSASAGPGIVPKSHSGTPTWVWVVAVGAVVLAVLAVLVVVRRRPRRRPPTGPTPPEPTKP
ncbi:MAG: hypothetical protein QOG65_1945, partial [Actinomycetota bacterium]|nr:hypothetical protein [Actinomycetota bacterium]